MRMYYIMTILEKDIPPLSDEDANKFVSAVEEYANSKDYSLTKDGKKVAFSYAKISSLPADVEKFFNKYDYNKDYFKKTYFLRGRYGSNPYIGGDYAISSKQYTGEIYHLERTIDKQKLTLTRDELMDLDGYQLYIESIPSADNLYKEGGGAKRSDQSAERVSKRTRTENPERHPLVDPGNTKYYLSDLGTTNNI